jgi:hypothetical protein
MLGHVAPFAQPYRISLGERFTSTKGAWTRHAIFPGAFGWRAATRGRVSDPEGRIERVRKKVSGLTLVIDCVAPHRWNRDRFLQRISNRYGHLGPS